MYTRLCFRCAVRSFCSFHSCSRNVPSDGCESVEEIIWQSAKYNWHSATYGSCIALWISLLDRVRIDVHRVHAFQSNEPNDSLITVRLFGKFVVKVQKDLIRVRLSSARTCNFQSLFFAFSFFSFEWLLNAHGNSVLVYVFWLGFIKTIK